ncbi:MAG: hypothetical protein ABMA13_05800 [Chthoniobacteraceae bacterium]
MCRSSLLVLLLVLPLAFGARVHSQTVTGAKSTLQQLQAMKAANLALIEKQTAVLLKLEELQKEAAQIKFLAKRG